MENGDQQEHQLTSFTFRALQRHNTTDDRSQGLRKQNYGKRNRSGCDWLDLRHQQYQGCCHFALKETQWRQALGPVRDKSDKEMGISYW